MYGRTYVTLYFDPRIFMFAGGRPVPILHKKESFGLAIFTRIISCLPFELRCF